MEVCLLEQVTWNRVHEAFPRGFQQRIPSSRTNPAKKATHAFERAAQVPICPTGSATSHASDIFGHGKHVFVTHPAGNGLHLRILAFARGEVFQRT